jgi:hypothetical protein
VIEALRLAKGLTEFIGLLLVAQGAVYLLSFGRQEENVIYRGVRFLTSPITAAVRRVTPAKVADRHLPVVAFALAFWVWVGLLVALATQLRSGA